MENNFKYCNLGYYFNKGYYKEAYSSVEAYFENISPSNEVSENILSNWLNEIKYSNIEESIKNIDDQLSFSNSNIKAKVNYPGLILGMGYAHNSIKIGEFQNGFSFDYTTGVPIIPGSSVKGAIRDVFPIKEHLKNKCVDIENITEFQNYCFAKGKLEWLEKIFSGIGIDSSKITNEFIFQFEKSIFGDEENQNQKIVFFDAYPIEGTSNNRLLGDDYITKHENPLKNPVPLRILKILPGVTIKFNFLIKDINVNGLIISKEKLETFFAEILKEFGVGARRNVGYGQFNSSSFKSYLYESKKKEKLLKKEKQEQKENEKKKFNENLNKVIKNQDLVTDDEHIKVLKEFELWNHDLIENYNKNKDKKTNKKTNKKTKNEKKIEYYNKYKYLIKK